MPCVGQPNVEFLTRRRATTLAEFVAVSFPDETTRVDSWAMVDVHVEIIIVAVSQFVEHGKTQVSLVGGHGEQACGHAVCVTETEGLSRVLSNEVVDNLRFDKAMNAG